MVVSAFNKRQATTLGQCWKFGLRVRGGNLGCQRRSFMQSHNGNRHPPTDTMCNPWAGSVGCSVPTWEGWEGNSLLLIRVDWVGQSFKEYP